MESRVKKVFATLIFCFLISSVSIAGVSVTSGLTNEKAALPGKTYKGIIQLRNNGGVPQEVKAYQTDYLYFCDGSNDYGEPGKAPRSNAYWITFSPHRQIIPPKSDAQINYSVSIPDNKDLAGTYWSMMMVESISASSPEAARPDKNKFTVGLQQIMRYGVQMRTNIGDTGTRKLKFLKTKLLKEQKTRILQIDIENIGEFYLRPSLWVELYDEKGKTTGKFEGTTLGVYPTTSVRFKIDLSQVPKGTYKSLVVADCGEADLFGATYTLKFE